MLAVTVAFLVPFAAFLLENNNFIAFEVLFNSSFNFGRLNNGSTNGNVGFVGDEQYFVKRNRCFRIFCKAIHKNGIVCSYFVLMTANLDNCEHDGKILWVVF